MSKGGCADRNDRAQHAQARWKPPLELLPVVLDPLPQRMAALGMGSQGGDWQVDVLALDVFAEREVEGALDELRGLGATERAQGRVALVSGGGMESLIDKRIILCKVSIIQSHLV